MPRLSAAVPLSPPLQKIMIQISEDLGVKKFILFGGAALDLLQNPYSSIKDLDIGIGGGSKFVNPCTEHLRQSGYTIMDRERKYFINIIDPVIGVLAKNSNWLLDIAFMNDVRRVGQFDIESLYWRFPECDYLDKFGALRALRERTMRPIYGLEKENPYLLLNRFIYASAKYGLNTHNNPIHLACITKLGVLISTWRPQNEYHGILAQAAYYSKLLKSLVVAKDRFTYVKDLARTRILLYTIPELQKPFEELKHSNPLFRATTKSEIAGVLLRTLGKIPRRRLKSKLQTLKLREWDTDDQLVVKNL